MFYNKVILTGNVVNEPEMKYSPNGKPFTKFNFVVNKYYNDPNTGEQKQKAMFIEVVVFGKTAEMAKQYIHKGMRLLVDGELNQEVWVDGNGYKKNRHNIYATKIVFLQPKNQTENNSQPQQQNVNNYQQVYNQQPQPQNQQVNAQAKHNPAPTQPSLDDLPDEDIPF